MAFTQQAGLHITTLAFTPGGPSHVITLPSSSSSSATLTATTKHSHAKAASRGDLSEDDAVDSSLADYIYIRPTPVDVALPHLRPRVEVRVPTVDSFPSLEQLDKNIVEEDPRILEIRQRGDIARAARAAEAAKAEYVKAEARKVAKAADAAKAARVANTAGHVRKAKTEANVNANAEEQRRVASLSALIGCTPTLASRVLSAYDGDQNAAAEYASKGPP